MKQMTQEQIAREKRWADEEIAHQRRQKAMDSLGIRQFELIGQEGKECYLGINGRYVACEEPETAHLIHRCIENAIQKALDDDTRNSMS